MVKNHLIVAHFTGKVSLSFDLIFPLISTEGVKNRETQEKFPKEFLCHSYIPNTTVGKKKNYSFQFFDLKILHPKQALKGR